MQSDTTLTVVQHLIASNVGQDTTVGSIVYVGCGLASDLAYYRAMSPERIILIEPNPDLAAELQELVSDDPLLTYMPIAISGTDGHGRMNIYNYFDICSLATPAALHEIYPGAQLEESIAVETITMKTLIDRIGLSHNGSNLLVVEAAGSESDIIQTLTSPEIAVHFNTIIISLPVHHLFSSSLSPANLITNMASAHYIHLISDTRTNPDWVRCIFRYSPTLANYAEKFSEQARGHEEKINSLKITHDTLIAALKADLTARDEAIAKQKIDSTMDLRLRTLHDNDMRDLQGRLQQAEQDRTELEDLLRAVAVQLRTAAQYVALLESNPEARIPAALTSSASNDVS